MFELSTPHRLWVQAPAWVQWAMIAAAGGLAGLGQAPVDQPTLTLVGLAFGFWIIRSQTCLPQFWRGWSLGFGYFFVSLAWIIEPFLVEGRGNAWLAPIALLAMAGGLALFWGAAFALARGRSGLWTCLALLAAELARSYLFTGFPWALLGYVWIDTPIYQLASIIGPHGMSLLTLVLAALIAWGGAVPRWVVLTMAIAAPFVPVAGHAPGPDNSPADDRRPIVRLIHPNVAQENKWHPDKMEAIYQRHLALTDAGPAVDLIIWPETSVYLPIEWARREIAEVAQGAHVVVGYQSHSPADQYFNTLGVVTPQGEVQSEYHKSRLVPFGEYIPFGQLARVFGYDFPEFSAGSGPAHIDIDGIGRIQPLICYEGIFPQFVGRGEARPDLLVLITNDGWFGEGQGPAQHFAQARARAIELGLPMLRVANRGVTAVIDPWGRSRERLDLHERGTLDAPIPKPRTATFYARYPWLGLVILLGGLVLGAFLSAQEKLSLTPRGGTSRKS